MRNALTREVLIQSNAVSITGDLTVPLGATTVIVFAHGSGSSRHSERNRYVADRLNRSGFATLLIDLLTLQEEREEHFTHHFRFDIELLAERLGSAVEYLASGESTKEMSIGLFGASTGSAAALACAAQKKNKIAAVVSRGGRPDLASSALPSVICPTLFIVGGFDPQVLVLNEKALQLMRCHREIEIVPGAGHLFDEVGKVDIVTSMATWWFARHCNFQGASRIMPRQASDSASPPLMKTVEHLENSGRHNFA
ncbi:MAG: dienelactone hydrolase family protein [Candidatus Obscuribacterales bacterium]|nr:dienelactone hydrolase family protein [Candidatus Obscuribacterales bacterium]